MLLMVGTLSAYCSLGHFQGFCVRDAPLQSIPSTADGLPKPKPRCFSLAALQAESSGDCGVLICSEHRTSGTIVQLT